MFNLDKFISDSVTFRPSSMFEPDIKANAETLTREIKGKKVCVIGGAGSIGSSFIKAVLRFEPESVVVVDLNENGLAELVRDVRSTNGLYVPNEFRCYTLNFADPIFERIFREEKGFPTLLHFSITSDNQWVMKREPIFPQHFHNNFICWEAKGNKALRMAFKTL